MDGDYVANGAGGQVGLTGEEALLQRVLFRLTTRRGMFPLLPELGSRLWLLGRERGSGRLSAAREYVAEALAAEDVAVETVTLTDAGGGRLRLTAKLLGREGGLTAVVTI